MSCGNAVDLAQALGQVAQASTSVDPDPVALLQFVQHIAQSIRREARGAEERVNAHRAAAAMEAGEEPEGRNGYAAARPAEMAFLHAGSMD
jgi:hypothetical protein